MLSDKDKLYHILACAFITIFTFLALVIALECYNNTICARLEGNNGAGSGDVEMAVAPSEEATDRLNDAKKCSTLMFCQRFPKKYVIIAGISGIASMAIGIAKEAGDAYNIWSLCQAVNEDGTTVGCQSSWGDIIADIVGVVLGEIMIYLALWLRFSLHHAHHNPEA